MMVLLVKHVHLQNDVPAINNRVSFLLPMGMEYGIQAAEESVEMARISKATKRSVRHRNIFGEQR
jgi:hypothetical protein